MLNWLTRVSETISRTAPREPEPFQIQCQCGQMAQGLRQTHFQRVDCRDCGEALLVLPEDVYPQPKRQKQAERKPVARKPARQDRDLEKPSTGGDGAPSKPVVEKPPKPPLHERLRKRVRETGSRTAASIRRAVKRRLAVFTPFRLVVLCMLAVVAATSYWVLHARALEQAQITLKQATENGYAALRKQQFAAAQKEFQIACQALDLLERDDRHALAVRRMLWESTALIELSDVSHLDLIREAQEKLKSAPDLWPAHFQKNYAGRWIVMETTVSEKIDSSGKTRYVIDLPYAVAGRHIVFKGDLELFAQLPPGSKSRQVVFAAQLDGCRLETEADKQQRWEISLRPKTAFFWTDPDNFLATGFRFDEFHPEEPTRRRLEEQATLSAKKFEDTGDATVLSSPLKKGRAKLLLSRKLQYSLKKTARQEPRPPMKSDFQRAVRERPLSGGSLGSSVLSAHAYFGGVNGTRLLDALWTSSPAADGRESMESFVQRMAEWPKLAEAKTRLKLEGRIQAMSRNYMQLKNCKLRFQLLGGKEFRKIANRKKTIEIVGHLEYELKRLVFIVERYNIRPSELETARIQQRVIDPKKPKEWYQLAEWMEQRGKFYEDAELLAEARTVYRKGIDIERRNLPANNPQALLMLAAKVAQFKLPELLRLEMVHEAYQLRWKTALEEKQPKLQQLADQMARDLPGCKIPLKTPQPKLQEGYRGDPLSVYRTTADVERRKLLHRIFYSQVIEKIVLGRAAADGSNGFAIAAEIDKQLPEQHALAERFRDRELEFQLAHIGTLTQQEAERLAERFRERNQPEKARETLKSWLDARQTGLRRDGPAGLERLADFYRSLLHDDKKAVELLKEAHQLNPESKEIVRKLDRLGYRLHKGRWVTKREFDNLPEDPEQRAIRLGEIQAGMTRPQVQKALGPPTSMTRIATARDVIEVWVYRQSGLSIQFHRNSRQRNAVAKVVMSR